MSAPSSAFRSAQRRSPTTRKASLPTFRKRRRRSCRRSVPVFTSHAGRTGLRRPSPVRSAAKTSTSSEQILAWQPEVILTVDRRFHATIRTDPVWREVKAVRAGQIHFVPDLPFSWLDNPPAPNRLIGLLWLGKLLYPGSFPQDIRAEARRFYALFYQQEPSNAQLDALLADPSA